MKWIRQRRRGKPVSMEVVTKPPGAGITLHTCADLYRESCIFTALKGHQRCGLPQKTGRTLGNTPDSADSTTKLGRWGRTHYVRAVPVASSWRGTWEMSGPYITRNSFFYKFGEQLAQGSSSRWRRLGRKTISTAGTFGMATTNVPFAFLLYYPFYIPFNIK